MDISTLTSVSTAWEEEGRGGKADAGLTEEYLGERGAEPRGGGCLTWCGTRGGPWRGLLQLRLLLLLASIHFLPTACLGPRNVSTRCGDSPPPPPARVRVLRTIRLIRPALPPPTLLLLTHLLYLDVYSIFFKSTYGIMPPVHSPRPQEIYSTVCKLGRLVLCTVVPGRGGF